MHPIPLLGMAAYHPADNVGLFFRFDTILRHDRRAQVDLIMDFFSATAGACSPLIQNQLLRL